MRRPLVRGQHIGGLLGGSDQARHVLSPALARVPIELLGTGEQVAKLGIGDAHCRRVPLAEWGRPKDAWSGETWQCGPRLGARRPRGGET